MLDIVPVLLDPSTLITITLVFLEVRRRVRRSLHRVVSSATLRRALKAALVAGGSAFLAVVDKGDGQEQELVRRKRRG